MSAIEPAWLCGLGGRVKIKKSRGPRRRNITTKEKREMRKLDKEGVERIHIAKIYGCVPACITLHLGKKRANRRGI